LNSSFLDNAGFDYQLVWVSRFRKGRVLNSNWKDIIHFDSVPSSSMALEDITDVIKI
jgi:hypothetical protein